jgi:hypothetical protein
MSTDPGKTHHVGDGCQPAHDPRIDQAPTDARVAAEAYRRASTGTGPVSFEELHAEYLVEIDAKVRAEADVKRLRALVETQNEVIKAVRSLRQRGGENPSRGVWPALHEVFDALDLLDSDKAN